MGGHRLEFEWHGPSGEYAPTLVFLHEGLGSVTHWRGFPKKLAEETACGALVYSRLGHGGSDPLDRPHAVTFMHEEAQVVLPEVLRTCGVQRPILFGHSDGASIALIYSGTRSGPVTGMVLEAPHIFVEDLSVASIQSMKERFETTNLKKKLKRHHGANTERMFQRWNDVWLTPEFRHWNIEELLQHITAPMLLIQGLDDPYGTVKQIEAITTRVRGGVETVLFPECGHSPHRERPEQTLDAASRFINGLRSAAPIAPPA